MEAKPVGYEYIRGRTVRSINGSLQHNSAPQFLTSLGAYT